jgi:hypothetical protein
MVGLSVEDLFNLYIDDEKSFAEDVYDVFGVGDLEGRATLEGFERKWGKYLPQFDPTRTRIGRQEKLFNIKQAFDADTLGKKSIQRSYDTEMDTLSTAVGKELDVAKSLQGGLGLRSGAVDKAIDTTIDTAFDTAASLENRFEISEKELDNRLNNKIVDSTLDFEKLKRDEKERFYKETMAMIQRLTELGAFSSDYVYPWYKEDTREGQSDETGRT